jgi:hypothetical protein
MILRFAICVCGLFLLFGIARAQEVELPSLPKGAVNVGDPAKIKSVLAREEEMRQAYMKLDPKLVAEFYADDYLTLTMGDRCCVGTREAQLQAVIAHRDAKPPYPITTITNEQTIVRVHGNVAVVTGVQKVVVTYIEETPRRTVTVPILFMNVWSFENGKWLLIGGSHKIVQATP